MEVLIHAHIFMGLFHCSPLNLKRFIAPASNNAVHALDGLIFHVSPLQSSATSLLPEFIYPAASFMLGKGHVQSTTLSTYTYGVQPLHIWIIGYFVCKLAEVLCL